jgi:hypothetical protein
MLRKLLTLSAAAGIAAAVGLTQVAPAGALPARVQTGVSEIVVQPGEPGYTEIRHRKGHYYKKKRWKHGYKRYRGHKHRWHYRHRHRHGAFRYYYGGWWYPRPWWTFGPGIYIHID